MKIAAKLNPKNALIHNDLASALHRGGKIDEAIPAYRKVIELDPQAAWPRDNLARCLNAAARALATQGEPASGDWTRAVNLANEAIDLKSQVGVYWKTLGVAHYRAASWKDAVAALEKSMELSKGSNSFDWFFLAMAHWQLGDKDKAREWYERAVQWMDNNQSGNEELRRFREEAAELLELKEKKQDGS